VPILAKTLLKIWKKKDGDFAKIKRATGRMDICALYYALV